MKRVTLALAIGMCAVLGACSSGSDGAASDTSIGSTTETTVNQLADSAAAETSATDSAAVDPAAETVPSEAGSDAGATETAAAAAAPNSEPCPDDGPRFPGTGICQGRVSAYFDPNHLLGNLPEPEGCEWSFNETMLATESEALIYRSLSCKGVTTKLAYGGGARSAELSYETSALYGDGIAGQNIVRMFVSDPADPNAVILSLREGLPPEEGAKCVVKKAALDGWPADALVMTYNDEAAKTLPTDEPNAVCGEFGLDEDTQNYWIVRQGFAYFFTLGQDDIDIDPGSFTYITKDAGGAWGAPA